MIYTILGVLGVVLGIVFWKITICIVLIAAIIYLLNKIFKSIS